MATSKTATTRKVWLPRHKQWVHLHHRDVMRRKRPMAKAVLPRAGTIAPPATTLPVDCTGNATVSCPMDGNDTLGICGPAMCDHVDGIRTYGQGHAGFTELHANLAALEAQYEQVSGGDNGTDEDMLVGASGIWTAAGGGLAADGTAIVADHLDVDVTNIDLAQYCIDQFYAVCMAWSVPDAFLQGFATGTVWPAAATPDPNNGHFTPLADIGGPADSSGGTSLNGFYRIWTWGSWAWVSPAFVASVDPVCFVTFSALQFNKATGFDSHGRHVSDQAEKWVALGGNVQAVAAVVSAFPAKPAAPTVAPTAGGVTLAQAQSWASAGVTAAGFLLTKAQAITAANEGLASGWPKEKATP
jgi:hypothetical protein